MTACSAPCELRLSETPLATQKWVPIRNEAKEMISPTTKATIVTITSFAKKTFNRRGCAARLVRIMPVAYSLVTARPKTTMTSCPRMMPNMDRKTKSLLAAARRYPRCGWPGPSCRGC